MALAPFLASLADNLDRNPDDLSDAFATGDAVAIFDDAGSAIIGFVYAQTLSRPRDRGLNVLRSYRVIDIAWTDPGLDSEDAISTRKRMLKELLRRLRAETVLIRADLVPLAQNCGTTNIGDIDRRARYRVMDTLGLTRKNEQEHEMAIRQMVGIVHPTEERRHHDAKVRIRLNEVPGELELHEF